MKHNLLFSFLLSVILIPTFQAVSAQKRGNTSHSKTESKQAKMFDMEKIPISDKPLGAFPYFNLPQGYYANSNNQPDDFAQFPFWVGDHFEWKEGKLYSNNIYPIEGKKFSQFEVEKNLNNLIASAGGVKVFQGKINSDSLEKLGDNIKVNYVAGLGNVYSNPATVYVIRRKDKDIWVQFCISSYDGGWVIMETQPFVQTASLISADDLKAQITDNGKAVIHLNFATDKADILPESQPQIEQVVALLNQDKSLKLSINGYTDNTGSPEHNKTLSKMRAESVMNTLTSAGIDKNRLQAKGFGASNPIGDNNTEEGKAKNRRVELVKM